MIRIARRPAAALFAVALLLAAAPDTQAATAQDRIFAVALLDAVPTGEDLVYDHDRAVAFVSERLPAIAGGRLELALVESAEGKREARVAFFDEPQVRRLNPFPADGGHPLLMVFMETAVHGMAAATGGSQFYIRSRMREALRTQSDPVPVLLTYSGQEVTGERYRFRPFLDDPNRERMGPFADMEINFVVSDAVPGTFAAVALQTGEVEGVRVLEETMVLRGVSLAE